MQFFNPPLAHSLCSVNIIGEHLPVVRTVVTSCGVYASTPESHFAQLQQCAMPDGQREQTITHLVCNISNPQPAHSLAFVDIIIGECLVSTIIMSCAVYNLTPKLHPV